MTGIVIALIAGVVVAVLAEVLTRRENRKWRGHTDSPAGSSAPSPKGKSDPAGDYPDSLAP